MKKGILLVSILIFVLQITASTRAFSSYLVGWEIEGRSYDNVSKRWVKGRFSISVGVDADNSSHLLFRAENSLTEAVVRQRYDIDVQSKLEGVISEAVQLLKTVPHSDTNPDKGLGCLGDGDTGLCNEQSVPFGKNQMAMRYGSSNNLSRSGLIFELADQRNPSLKAIIYFDETKIKQVSNLISNIPDTIMKMQGKAQHSSLSSRR